MMLSNNLVVILIVEISLLDISKCSNVSAWKNVKHVSRMSSENHSSENFRNNTPLRNRWLNETSNNNLNQANESLIHTNDKSKYVCCDGCIKLDSKCIPPCSPFCGKEDICARPKQCICRSKDYYKNLNGTRRAACSEEYEKNNEHCLTPNVCSCLPGYKKTGNFSSSFTCEPECLPACINDHCVKPSKCGCMDGYEHDVSFSCKPKCKVPCVYGTCTKPETCTCNNGYKAVNATVCEPICSKLCINSTCVAPDSCSCFKGYKLLKNSSYICEPICKVNCGNGTCTAPEMCTCDEKLFNYNNQTDPMCQSNCRLHCDDKKSKCEIHNVHNNCTCVKGYRPSAFLINITEIYKKEQQLSLFNANLSSHLLLHPKVSMEEDLEKYFSELLCQPVCDLDCINGTCAKPNKCACHAGFHSSSINNNTAHICVENAPPVLTCDAIKCGNNEICNKSGFCTCKAGYRKNVLGHCVSSCTLECINGTCTAQNRCICNAGYRLRNEHFCEPICENGCKNGNCTAPNRCHCHDNFVQNTGQRYVDDCIPACTRNCSGHGVCVIDDEYSCKCHFGWTGLDCDQPTMCAILMDFNHSDINRITIRNDTNSTIIQTYKNAPHCSQCNNSFSNESLCYLLSVIHPEKAHMTSSLGCLLDLPCRPVQIIKCGYTVTNRTNVIATILIVISVATVIIYFICKRYRKKLATNITISLAKLYANSESLLSTNTEY